MLCGGCFSLATANNLLCAHGDAGFVPVRYNRLDRPKRTGVMPKMPAHVLTTKLYAPTLRPEFVSRPRLLARLDAGLRHRLTLVSAPAGFGRITSYNVCYTKLLRMFPNIEGKEWFKASCKWIVITSYSIHYTKLYESIPF